MRPAPRLALLAVLGALAASMLVIAAPMDRPWFELHFMRLRCAVDQGDLRSMTVLRAMLVAGGVAGLLGLRPLGRWLKRGAAGTMLLRVAIAAVLAIVVSDLLLRSRSRAGKPPLVLIQLPPIRDDARLGWRYDGPRTTVLVDDERAVMYAVDPSGARVHAQTDAIDPSRPTLLFVGESVTFGLGVHWEEAFPTLVGRSLGTQVVNAAVHGYGDDQIYAMALERLSELRRPTAVVWLVMADLLERDVATWRGRLDATAEGTLLPIPEQPKLARESPVIALFERLGPWQSGGSVLIARSIYTAMDAAARARGADPLFVLTNYQRACLPDASGRPSIEGLLFDGLPLHHVRVDLDPTAIIHTNGHPDPSSHARLAAAVTLALQAR